MVVGLQTVGRVPTKRVMVSNDCAEYTSATFTIVSRLSANYRKLAQQCFNPTEGIISKRNGFTNTAIRWSALWPFGIVAYRRRDAGRGCVDLTTVDVDQCGRAASMYAAISWGIVAGLNVQV
jgi:hypothetical protein